MQKKDNGYITTNELAQRLHITGERVRQLADEGVITIAGKMGRNRYFDKDKAIDDYLVRMQEIRNEKPAKDIDEALALADLRYKEARAGKIELELAELEGTMHRAEDVEAVVSDVIANLRGELLALPGKLAVDTANARTPRETSAIIKAEIDRLLNGMARYEYDAEEYKKRVREREKWISIQEAEQEKKKTEKQTEKKPRASSGGSARASKRRKT